MPTRTNIEIDDRLMRQAMRTGKGRTKRAVVEAGLALAGADSRAEGHSQVEGKGALGRRSFLSLAKVADKRSRGGHR